MNILNRFSLSGKVAILTGGAGLYGRQIAQALASAGADVTIASRNIDALENFAAELREQGLLLQAMPVDLSSEASILELRDGLVNRAKCVDVLVNNAVLRPMKDGYASSAETFEESMRVNATGLFLITRAFGDAMAERGSGSIVNIGSIQGMVGPYVSLYDDMPFDGRVPDYFFHKGGMVNYTRFLASYYGSSGVRCNCISPGGLQTDKTPEAFVERYSEHTCLGRMAGDTDLMGAVVFFASDASLYVTGVNLPVDGGYTVK